MSILTGSPIGPNLFGTSSDETPAERLAKEESALRAMRGDNAFTQGFQSASTGLAAGESALRGQEAEGAGNVEEAARQRAYSLRQLADASILAPETQSYTQVDDVGSALNYAGGAAGSALPTLLPSLAVGLLTRGRGTGAFAKGTAYAGALVPSYQMERNEALTSQLTDPAAMERSYADRQLAARAKGVAGGMTEAILPAGLAAGFGKAGSKALNTVAGSAVTEGLTEGAQQYIGQQAQSYLNPNRETADDGTQIIDAMIQGAIGGTTISGPNAVAGTVANQLEANKDKIGENLSGYREKLKDLPNPVDRLRNAFSDPVRDDAEAAEFGDADPSLRGATPEETMSNMDKRKAELGSIYERLKTSVQERLPKAWLEKVNPDNPESYAAAIRDYDYSKKINGFVDAGKDIVDKFKKGEKNNLMSADPDTSARIYSMVIKNADPEIRDTSEFRKNAQTIGNTLTAFATRQGDITADEIPTIVSMASQIRDIFPDTEALSKELSNFVALEGSDNSFMRRIMDVKSAAADVAEAQSKKRKDVFLVQALEPEARKVLMQRPRSINRLADLVDEAAGSGKMSKDMLAGLSDAFGGEQQAKAVVGYYRKQIRDSLKFEDSTQLEDADGVVIEADGLSDKEIQSGVTEREAAPQNVAYKFADVRTKRPFLGRGVTLNEGGMRRQVREATKAIVEMKKTGQLESGARGRVIPFSQYIEETGGDLARERARLLTAAEKNKSAVEIKFLKDKTISDKEALSIYETVKVERNPQAEDPLAVSDADLKKMRTLLDGTPNPNVGSPAARKAAREKIEKIRETAVTFYTKEGKPIHLSAESMWKTMGDKKNPEAGIDAGPRRAKRLFADAVTSILQRPDIDGKRIPDISNVMLDTATGRRAGSPDSRPGKGDSDVTSRIENDAKDIEEAVEDNNFDAVEDIVTRLEADAREGERMLADLKDADGRKRSVDDFRQRYAAARKAGQSAEALEKIRRIGEFSNDPDAQKQMKDNVAALRAAARDFMSMSREAELAQKAETQGEGGVENMTQEKNAEVKGPRNYEEDTGLKVGKEIRGSTPVAAKREVGKSFDIKPKRQAGLKPMPTRKVAPDPKEETTTPGNKAFSKFNSQLGATPELFKLLDSVVDMTPTAYEHRRMPNDAWEKVKKGFLEETVNNDDRLAEVAKLAVAERSLIPAPGEMDFMFTSRLDSVFSLNALVATTRALMVRAGPFGEGRFTKEYNENVARMLVARVISIRRALRDAPMGLEDRPQLTGAAAASAVEAWDALADMTADLAKEGNEIAVKDAAEAAEKIAFLSGGDAGVETAVRTLKVFAKSAVLKQVKFKMPGADDFDNMMAGPRYNDDTATVTMPVGNAVAGYIKDYMHPASVLAHELTHALTYRGEHLDPKLHRDLSALLKHTRAHLEESQDFTSDMIYGLINTQEFLAEAFSNKSFQDMLRKVPALHTESYKNAWQEFRALVGKILGLVTGEKLAANALEELLTLGIAAGKISNLKAQSGISKYNSQLGGATPGKVLSAEEQAAIIADIETMLGKDIKVEFGTFAGIGGSGSYSTKTGQRVIKLAMDSLNPGSVALHESIHDFFAQLGADKNTEKMKRELLQAAESAPVYAQLKALLQGHPEALKQIESDPEERLAYMFQFHFMGRPDGSRMLNLGSGTIKIFERLAQMIRKLLGVASQEQRVEEYLNALRSGKFADISAAGQVAAQIQSTETLAEKIKEKMGIVSDISDRMFTATTDRLRETDVPALVKIADLFHVEPGREEGKLRHLQRKSQMAGKYGNRLQDILANSTAAERTAAVENLESMRPAQTPMEKEIRALLEDLYQYMDKAGVKRKVKGKYVSLPHLKDYFPRNWDPSRIAGQSAQFIADLMQYGKYNAEDAGNIAGYMMKMDEGSVDLGENEHHLGYTPYTKAVIERTQNFQFIDATNADKFAKYQSKDLVEIMSTYINQAVHRAEYARDFGNDGEVLTDLIEEAQKQGATPADIKMAGTATRALEGTLGSAYSPKMRALMNGVITMENLILLPLSLFSQVVDVAGIGARSNNFKESLTALNDGAKALARSFTKIPPGEAEEMAKTLGIIDEQNMLEAMGQVHSSMYMSNKLKKINRAFFRLNRMEAWNRQMRVSAMTAGQRFLLANKDNARYMAELDLRPSDVVATPDGLIAMTQADGLTAGQEKRVHDAIFRFVDSAVLRPNAAHRPIWGNDPRFMLLFHLKQFTYSFQNTFIRNMNKELQFGNPKAALIMLTTIPFMIASDIARAALTGTTNPDQTVMGYLARGLARSGLLGNKAFGTDAYSDATAGQLPGKSFLGPAAEHGILLLKGLLGVPGTTGSDILLRSIPGGTALRGVVDNQ